MAAENFTTYTEVDPNSRIAVTSSRVTRTSITRNETAYVYKDKGADHFNGDFEHLLTICVTSSDATGVSWCWAMTNTIGDLQTIIDAAGSYFAIASQYATLLLVECNSGSLANDSSVLTLNTTYYLKIVRDETVGTYGTLYCYIYSDAARTTLVDTMFLTLQTSKKDFRYIFASTTRDQDINYVQSSYSENLIFVIGTTAPSVTTQAVTAIDKTTATGNGNITSLGLPEATQYGHCWATHPNPTTSDSKIEKGVPSATGAYTSALTGLIPNTLYYCRAYITNSVGTFYGAEVTFTTLADAPVVTTDLATEVAATTALGNGSIDNNGGSAITQHGVCWGATENPTTADSKTEDGATDVIGDFFSLMTGLTAATTYHVRAYATNATGTGYGANVTFTTLAAGAPIVTTEATTNIQATGATGNGTIVDIGASAVTEHGHCWGTSVNPTTADSKTTKGAGVAGAFTSSITGLTAGTLYHTRAYATNSYGTSYGNDVLIKKYGEGAGILTVLGEHLAYLSKAGNQRALLGELF